MQTVSWQRTHDIWHAYDWMNSTRFAVFLFNDVLYPLNRPQQLMHLRSSWLCTLAPPLKRSQSYSALKLQQKRVISFI